jgi:hypothetical protein
MWLRSTATPGTTGATSYSARCEPAGSWFFNSSDRGWPEVGARDGPVKEAGF